jgi:hypothetical protein
MWFGVLDVVLGSLGVKRREESPADADLEILIKSVEWKCLFLVYGSCLPRSQGCYGRYNNCFSIVCVSSEVW